MKKLLLTLVGLIVSLTVMAQTTINFAAQFPNLATNGSEDLTTLTVGDVTLTFAQGSGNNAPKYYENGASARMYASNSMAVSSTKEIASITFTSTTTSTSQNLLNFSCGNTGTYSAATNGLSAEWKAPTGGSKDVTFTVTSGQCRFTEMVVNFVDGETVTPEPDPDPTPGEGTEVTFNFVEDTYGAGPAYSGSSTAYVSSDNVATNENVRVTFGGDSSAWRFWSDGIRAYKNKNAYFTVEALSGNITAINFTVISGATFAVEGTSENVTSWTGSAPSVRFNYTANDNKALITLTVTVAGGQEITVVAPKVSCVDNMVSMSCETEGASIYYTIDGNEPSASSNLYSNPFPITAKTVVKAIAIKGSDKSAITTYNAEYVGKYASFQDLVNAGANAEGTVEGPITAVYQNGQYLFVVDNTNYPMLVYGTISESLNNGDQIASVKGKYSPYNNLPEIANPVLGNITPGTPVQPQEVTTAITNDMINRYVVFNGATLSSATDMTYGDNLSAVLYKRFNDVEIPTDYDKKYNVTGFVSIFGANLQVYPVSFEEVTEPAPVEPVTVAEVNPKNGTTLPIEEIEDVTVYVTFTGDAVVKSAGYGNSAVGGSAASSPAFGESATNWTFTIPASYIKNLIMDYEADELALGFPLTIEAYYNDGDEQVDIEGLNLYYYIETSIQPGAPFNVEVAETAEGSLNTFNVTPGEGFNAISASSALNEITITGMNYNGKVTAYANGEVTFSPAITASGSYVINFPVNAFNLSVSDGSSAGGDTEGDNTSGSLGGDMTIRSQAKEYSFSVTINNPNTDTPTGDMLPIDESFTPECFKAYTFAPYGSGDLSLTITDGESLFYFWFSSPMLSDENGKEVEPTYTNGSADTPQGATEFIWSLDGGKTYTFYLPVDKTPEELGKYFFTYSGEILPPSTPPTIVYEEMKFNELYETPENGSVTLQFTPTVDGTLTVTQRGNNSLSYVYSEMPNLDDLEENLIEDPVVGGSQMVRELTYSLTANHTYYVYAKRYNNSLTSLMFEFVGEDEGGGDEPTGEEITLDTPTNVIGATPYYFKAPETGVLTLNVNARSSLVVWAGEQEVFYYDAEGQNAVPMLEGSPYDSTVEGYTTAMDFDVEEGEIYYVYLASPYDSYRFYLTMKSEPVSEYLPLETGIDYTADGVGVLKLQVTPEADAILVATQMGSYDTHLWSEIPNLEDDGIYIENNLVGTIGGIYSGNASTGYVLEYDLKAGHTYYVYAKINAYDDFASVTYEWKEVEEGLVINLEQMTTVKMNEIYTFTAPETGVLTVNVNSFSVYGTDQYWVYSNAACTEPMRFVEKDDSEVLNGLALTFNVEKGQKYYFTNTDFDPITFYLTLEEGDLNPSKIVSIEPTPGSAYNFVDYSNYWNLVTSPTGATVESVELVYTDRSNTEQRVAVTDFFNPDGTLRISASALAAAKDDIMNDTYAVFELKGLKAGGKVVTESDITEGVTVDENGNVTVSFKVESPIVVETKEFPTPFYNVYPAGAADAKAILTFSGDIASIGDVKMIAGVYTPGNVGGESATAMVTIPSSNINVSGNSITVDFAGLNMSSLGTTASFVITTIIGENGLPCAFNGYPEFIEVVTLVAPSTEPEELAGNLVFDNFEMTYIEGSDLGDEVEVPVSLELTSGSLTYMAFQFDITLPEGMSVTKTAVGECYPAGSEAQFSLYNKEDNTYRVVVTPAMNNGVGYTDTEDLVTLTISATYAALDGKAEYPAVEPVVIIDNTVFFSSVEGDDITDIKGHEGTVTINDKTNRTTAIEFGDVTLNKPSYTYPEVTDVDAVTQGEGLVMEVIITTENPEDANDQALEFTITIGDEEITGDDVWDYIEWDPETGNWIFNTDDIDATNGDVTVKVTATSGDFSAEYEFTVRGILLGDSNFNGEVTVADVVTTANYVASLNSTRFDWINANVILNDNDPDNDDITIQDVTATVEIILGTFDDNRNPVQNVRRQARTMVSSDYLTVADFKVKDNDPFMIGVNLENTNSYSAIQAEVEIPEGMKVVKVTEGPRAANHRLIYNVTDYGTVKVVMFSPINAAFAEIEGSLFNLEVVADEDCGNIRIEKIRAADAKSNGYELSFQGGENVTGTTGIDGIDAENSDVRYFTVDGIEIVNPEAGQIVIRVEGNKVEKVVVK